MKPRIIVCGLSRTGYRVFRLLKQQGAMVVGIHPQPLADRPENIVVGELSAASTLIAAGIREADTLVIAHGDDAVNLAVLTQARVLNPRIRIINRLPRLFAARSFQYECVGAFGSDFCLCGDGRSGDRAVAIV
jgi:Trk K+ transport system NAD-binding subunit